MREVELSSLLVSRGAVNQVMTEDKGHWGQFRMWEFSISVEHRKNVHVIICSVSVSVPSHYRNSYPRPRTLQRDKKKQTPWPEVRKRIIPTQRPPLVGEVVQLLRIKCHVVSATDPHGRSRCFLEVVPQISSRGWMNLVPDTLLLRNLTAPGIAPGTSGSVAKNSDR
jgi:hypothetical protein